jgi:thiol-disulfide isomerase/thioredoxin
MFNTRVIRLFLLLILFISKLFAQHIEFSFNCNFNDKQLFLGKYRGYDIIKIDSAVVNEGKVVFEREFEKGAYVIQFSDSNRVDFLINPSEKKIIFKFNDCKLVNHLVVVESNENKLFWDYKYYSKSVNDAIKEERIKQSNVPRSDEVMISFYEENIQSLNNKKKQFLKSLAGENPNLFFSESSLLFERLNDTYLSKSQGQDEMLKFIPFSKEEYLNTTFFSAAIMVFLQNYTEYTELGFKASVDRILSAAQVNDKVFNFHLNFLLDLFKRVGPDVVFDYLVEKYLLNESCSNNDLKENYHKILLEYNSIQPGVKAPDFEIVSEQVKYNLESLLSLMKHNEALLFFYSSHCEFCHKAINQIEQNSTKYNNIDIVFISLDTDIELWKNFRSAHKLEGIHWCDLKAWNSDIAKKYIVHRTPTFYKIDKKGNIILRGSNLDEVMLK